MKAAFLRITLALALCLGVSGTVLPARAQTPVGPAAAEPARGVSPAGMLNVDGTLKLTPDSSGALDLAGWTVTLDPARGPVFGPAPVDDAPEFPAATVQGNWAAVGDGGGVMDAFIRAIVVTGTVAYIGGDFTDVANIPEADYVARWDGMSWSALSGDGAGNGALDSTVNALAVSGTKLYVGGWFSRVYDGSTTPVTGGASVALWDGAHWSGLGSNGAGGSSLNNGVNALAISGTDLFVGGQFTDVNDGGTPLPAADYVARWDGTHWSALSSDGAGNGSLSAGVMALAATGGSLYVGGYFTNVSDNGTPVPAADYIAQWDGTHWSALGSNGAGNGAFSNGYVNALAVSGSDVYVAGGFSNVSDSGTPVPAADYVARWDGTHWSALGSNGAGDGALDYPVSALWVSGADLYVGGGFTNVNNGGVVLGAADYLARWDGAAWSAIGSNGAGGGSITNKGGAVVMAIAQLSGRLLVGGLFYDLNDGGATVPQADYLAGWDGAHWAALGTEPNGALVNGYASSAVYAILVNGTDVYVGGHFTNVSNHGDNLPAADFVAKWDGANWSALGSNGAGDGAITARVTSLAMVGSSLYVGGVFSNVNNNGTPLAAADHIAKWDGANWSALGSNGAGNGALSPSSYVGALAASGTTLYVGGNFTNVNNSGVVLSTADRIASWDGVSWSALGTNGAGDGSIQNGSVAALVVTGTTLYVGGYFTDVNDNGSPLPAADYIAAWNGTHWSALGDNGAGGGSLNGGVNAIAVTGTQVYAGGSFTDVNNHGVILPEADYIAVWSGTNWSALGNSGTGVGALNGQVQAIALEGANVYAGGWYRDVNNGGAVVSAADYVARWDGTDWTALGINGQSVGSLTNNVQALVLDGTDLWVGGAFTNVRNHGTDPIKEADYLATYGTQPAPPPPVVASVLRGNVNPAGSDVVQYGLLFSKSVTGVDAADFAVTTTGIAGASINSVSGSGTTYTVMVNTGTGSGTLRLDVVDNDTILDVSLQPLGGVGAGNGDYTSGEVYTIDKSVPVVVSSLRVDPNPTRADSVSFVVTFSESVANVDVTDFVLTTSGLAGAAISSVSGSGTTYTVLVTTGVGSGTLRLDLIDDDSIIDGAHNWLGGAGLGTGDYVAGEAYNVRNRWIYLPQLQRGP